MRKQTWIFEENKYIYRVKYEKQHVHTELRPFGYFCNIQNDIMACHKDVTSMSWNV